MSLSQQLSLFPEPPEVIADLSQYDYILLAFSGGKDSVACFLRLLELGVNAKKNKWEH